MILSTPQGDSALRGAARPANPWGAFGGLSSDTYSGRPMTPEGALGLSAVYGAVSLIANTCGTLPLGVVDTRKANSPVEYGALATMLRFAPNTDMTGAGLWTLVFNHLLLRGNAYLAKFRNAQGYVNELVPLNPADVHPFRADDGRKLFRVAVFDGLAHEDLVVDHNSILHIMGPSFDRGLVGASPIAVTRARMGVQAAQSEYQGRFYERGGALKGALTVPGDLNPEAAERIKRQWRISQSGLDNAHDIAVLHSGATFQPVTLGPDDAEFVETMKYGATEVATIFSLPASRLNADSGSNSIKYASSSQDDLHMFKSAILPRLTMVEQALNADTDLFGATSAWVPRFNVEAVLRADIKTRYESYAIALDRGWMTASEVRAFEDLPPANIPAPAA